MNFDKENNKMEKEKIKKNINAKICEWKTFSKNNENITWF